nr:MAG TPA: DNA polymerase B [Caudoviricetes sp.]
MRKFTADFETTTDPNDCRVWAYAICEIGNINNFYYGNSINDFIEFCKNKKENYVLYFHNLKFDGEYIFNYLLNNDYKCIKDKRDRENKTFTALISDTGQFYSIEIFFETKNKKHVNKVTIYDSLKILNFSVDKIAKDFNLPIRKLELDYHVKREIGHILTEQEIDYIKNDVEIMARALEFMFNENLNKMTIGSDALHNYKEMNTNFSKYFPILPYEIDLDIRRSYKGGFTYLNEVYKEKETGSGIVLDVNSLYPSVMKYEKLPFGEPLYFDGEYKEDTLYSLYIQTFSCSFELKKGKIPSIQIKNNLSFLPNEYIKSSNGDIVTLTLTNIDLKLFFENYDVYDLIYHSGWKFKGIKGLFTNYIDYWSERKITAKKEKNNVLYIISKLMLNSLYGKFGLNPNVQGKYPYLNEDGIVKYKMYPKEIRDSIYIPVASFITSYARNKTIRTSQAIKDYTIKNYNKDYYIYSDTDSIHFLDIDENILKSFVDIDDYKLGAWKIESKFIKGKYIRQKCYIELGYDDKLNVTVAGLPKKLGKYVTFENFNKGMQILANDTEKEHKLTFKHVKGGVILADTDFSIK